MKKIRINNFKEEVYYEKLKNGLVVYILPLKNKKLFTAMLNIKYGGRDINFKVSDKLYKTPTGIAHFLEHKMFERELSPFDFYSKYGSDVNAMTSNDYTSYYFSGTKGFYKSLSYLINWITSFEIDEEMVKKEQGIILEEANMYKDNPGSVMSKTINQNIYLKDPKQNEVIGTDKDIVSITKNDLELCYNTFYTADNMSLVICGGIDPKKTIELVKKEAKKIKTNKNKVTRIYHNEPDKVKKASQTIKMNVGSKKIAVAYKMNKKAFNSLNISKFELDIYLDSLFNIALGPTSKTRNKWLEENLFVSSSYMLDDIESHYIALFNASSDYPDKLLTKFRNYLKNLEITKEAFEREKKLWISNNTRRVDNVIGMAYEIVHDYLDFGKYINNKNDIIRNMTFDMLLKVKNACSYKNEAVVKILPKK